MKKSAQIIELLHFGSIGMDKPQRFIAEDAPANKKKERKLNETILVLFSPLSWGSDPGAVCPWWWWSNP